jgi:membrane protein
MEGFTYRAAALAYTTLLAIVPIMIISFSILSFFPAFSGFADVIQQFILHNFVAESASVISSHLKYFMSNVHRLTDYNIIFLVILNFLMLYNIIVAFNAVWKAKPKLSWSLQFLIYFVFLLAAPLFLGGVLVLASFLYKIKYIEHLIRSEALRKPFFILLPHIVTLITFTLFNWVLPFCRVRFIHALLGGFITTVIFELAKSGFAYYISHYSTYRLLYGTLSILPLFLVWLYVSWLIILLGAIVTNLVADGIPKNWKQKFWHP